MKLLTSFLLVITISVISLKGQSPQGTLKIFSDNPLVVYVDETHYPQYGEILLAPGTHWVKVINADGVRVYSQIVTVKNGEVTSVLIEAPQAGNLSTQTAAAQTAAQTGAAQTAAQTTSAQAPATQTAAAQTAAAPTTTGQATTAPTSQGQLPAGQNTTGQAGVTYMQTGSGMQAGQTGPVQESKQEPARPTEEEVPAAPVQTIDIGQAGGTLPPDMSGAFGLTFGMSTGDVDEIMSPKSAQAQRNTGYSVYAIPKGSSFCIVECRFIDKKLFQIIVGYISTSTDKSRLKLNKGEVPVPEFNQMLNDVTAVYGPAGTAERIFLAGYTDDDGRLLEALKKKKALLLHQWTDPATGNYIMVGLGYTTAPLAATIYTSGPMSTEAAARKLRIHAYDYHKSFKDNYFSN